VTEISGRLPINTDGGLIANGEPIGASGLRQIHELVLQLRGEAGARQVPNDSRIGLAHLYGAPAPPQYRSSHWGDVEKACPG
jgi:acetyl-CoA acetyltransferase